MELNDLFQVAADSRASDIHVVTGAPPVLRIDGELQPTDLDPLTPRETERLIRNTLDDAAFARLQEEGDLDYSVGVPHLGRFRINAHRQRGSYAAAIRFIPNEIPSLDRLGLPPRVEEFTSLAHGLVLVTGQTGTGKSTTLAAMIDLINQRYPHHIITLEDPIEFVFPHGRSIVEQREIGIDSRSFADALRHVVRQDPDVILVGEMRDLETIATAMTAAETGHLVFATLHTMNAPQTVDRIIDVFPPDQQSQIRLMLANSLQGVISQILLRRADGPGMVPAVEMMVCTPPVRRCIREGETHLIQGIVETGRKFGMQSMDQAICEMCLNGYVMPEEGLSQAANADALEKQLLATR